MHAHVIGQQGAPNPKPTLSHSKPYIDFLFPLLSPCRSQQTELCQRPKYLCDIRPTSDITGLMRATAATRIRLLRNVPVAAQVSSRPTALGFHQIWRRSFAKVEHEKCKVYDVYNKGGVIPSADSSQGDKPPPDERTLKLGKSTSPAAVFVGFEHFLTLFQRYAYSMTGCPHSLLHHSPRKSYLPR